MGLLNGAHAAREGKTLQPRLCHTLTATLKPSAWFAKPYRLETWRGKNEHHIQFNCPGCPRRLLLLYSAFEQAC